MNRAIFIALLCTPICFAAAVNASELTEHSSQKLTMHFAGSGDHTLEVRTIEGNITVEAYDGPDVEMTVDKSLSAQNEDEMRAAHRDVALDIGNNGATIHAIVQYPNQQTCGGRDGFSSHSGYHARFDFTIRVPRTVRLELCTINDGVVSVSGTGGDFDVSNVNGRIAMTNVAGSGRAITVNGAVAASFISAPQRSCTFRTVNGDVAVTLPDRSSADFHMKTLNGRLLTDFAVEPEPQNGGVIRESIGGLSVIRTSGFTSVRAGNGGPDLTLESLNGDVRVLRRSK
jgi:DUF4097 and DUF4098 domain-containing protein YvlB